jgi:phosphohistidine phosphatase
MDNIMLVGHLPFMERLTSFLITGSIDKPVLKFQNGGIVCMDRDPDNQYWFIKWALMPVTE